MSSTRAPKTRRNLRSLSKGALAGALGGLAGACTMNQSQQLFDKPSQPGRVNGRRFHQTQESLKRTQSQDTEITQKLAQRIARRLLHRTLTKQEMHVAEPLVHYSIGTVAGTFYGIVCELAPAASKGLGLLFGAAVWLAADEVGAPAFGLAKSPLENPISAQYSALTVHLVFGGTAELVRRALRRVLA